MQAPTRTASGGPALVRLLTRLADLDVSAPASSLSDRLSQWLGWTDAIALSNALAGDPPASAGARIAASAEFEASARTRAALVKAIARDERAEAAAHGRHRAPLNPPPDEAPADFTLFRQRYLSLQQSMATDIGALRARLRAALAAHSPDTTRLAVLDAVMEQALAAREHALLAQVPLLLGQYFERLRRAQLDADADADARDDAPASTAWLDGFRQDMQSVLLAELDVRFQPVEGLLAALRAR